MRTQTIVAALLAFPSIAFADLKGSDSFTALRLSDWYFGSSGGLDLFIQNSRLEYLVTSPANINYADLIWQPNTGGYNQSWFVEVDISLGIVAFPDDGDYQDLSLNVFPSADRGLRVFSIGLNQTRANGFVDRVIAVRDTRIYQAEQRSNSPTATLRLHHDKKTRTITPSWNTGSGWVYGGPRDVVAWDMKPSETFVVLLSAKNGALVAENAKVPSGQAWFKNFRTGNATPDIVVERSPSSEIKSRKGTISFGAAKAGVGKVTKSFKIRNHGTAELRGLKLSVVGADARNFRFSKLTKEELPPGASTTFKVTFAPGNSGLRKAKVFLTSTDPDESAFQINVSGRGVD